MSGCVLNRRFRCNARNTLLSAAGASWHTQGTRCQSSAGTCSVDQWDFFFLFLELKTGSGRPGINSLRTRLNPPSQTIRSKYVNPTSKITSLWNKLSLKKKQVQVIWKSLKILQLAYLNHIQTRRYSVFQKPKKAGTPLVLVLATWMSGNNI